MRDYWSCVVYDIATGAILARYDYDTRKQAAEIVSSVRELRIKQNHERVRVILEHTTEMP